MTPLFALKKQLLHSVNSVRFRRWSRKGFAVFAGLNKVISIGHVSVGITEKSLRKNKKETVETSISDTHHDDEKREKGENENTFAEIFLQFIFTPSTAIPASGQLKYYLFNHKVEMEQSLCFNLF